MSTDNSRATIAPEDLDVSTERDAPTAPTPMERLRSRVLDLLNAPDPVCGIYAMYGAHERHPQKCVPTN